MCMMVKVMQRTVDHKPSEGVLIGSAVPRRHLARASRTVFGFYGRRPSASRTAFANDLHGQRSATY